MHDHPPITERGVRKSFRKEITSALLKKDVMTFNKGNSE